MEEILYKIKREKKEITKNNIQEMIENIENENHRCILKKVFQEQFHEVDSFYHISLYQLYGDYLKAQFVAMIINQEESAKIIQYLGHHLLDKENETLSKIGISLKSETLPQYKRCLEI